MDYHFECHQRAEVAAENLYAVHDFLGASLARLDNITVAQMPNVSVVRDALRDHRFECEHTGGLSHSRAKQHADEAQFIQRHVTFAVLRLMQLGEMM